MARGTMHHRRLLSRKFSSPRSPVRAGKKEQNPSKTVFALEKRDWENAICSVCLEFPHNAVLLLCASHNKGCRPYMCATSCRYSNCLDQFKKAYAKEVSPRGKSSGSNGSLGLPSPKVLELSCPLCRGPVKGWTVVEQARQYLNKKKRSCMQDNCSFRGTYKKLRKHVRNKHASAKPCKVDPSLEEKWQKLEYQSERADVMSVIRTSMPGSMVMGDYVIGPSDTDMDTDTDTNLFSDGEDSDSDIFADNFFAEEEDFGGEHMRIFRRGNIRSSRVNIGSFRHFNRGSALRGRVRRGYFF